MSKKRKARYIPPSEDFGGFGWLGTSDPTPEQMKMVHFLAIWRRGTHHFNGNIDECGPKGVTLTCSHYDLSTYDTDRLTSLVLLAHRFGVRVEIGAAAPGYVRIHCHQRKLGRHPEQRIWEGHPSLQDLIDRAELMKDGVQ